MAKLTLSDVSNLTGAESAAIATINANWDAIVAAIENTLSRDGTSPNQMAADIDMNSNDLMNVATGDFVSIDTSSLTIDGVEAYNVADADTILSVIKTIDGSGSGLDADLLDGQEGAWYQDADNHTSGTTNKVYSATEQTKLSGIETGADVTDATNVEAAGALMASNNLSEVSSTTTSRSNLGLASYVNYTLGKGNDTGWTTTTGTSAFTNVSGRGWVKASTGSTSYETSHQGVMPGVTYTLLTTVYVSAGTARVYLGVRSYDSAGTALAYHYPGSPQYDDLTTADGVTTIEHTITGDDILSAQATATDIRLLIAVDTLGSGATVEVLGGILLPHVAMTAAERTKLAGVETGAQVNTVNSVNTKVGAVTLSTDDISDVGKTNKFTTAGDISKLAGIEAGADVTDATNVEAAGAMMAANNGSDISVSDTFLDNLGGTTVGKAVFTAASELAARTAIGAESGMYTATYDPTSVAGDVFDMDNMIEGTDTKIMTAAERATIASASVVFDSTDVAFYEPSGGDDTSAIQALLTAGTSKIEFLPGTYIIDSVSITSDVEFVCPTGVVFQRKANTVAEESYWATGTGMFEIDYDGFRVAFRGEPTFDMNKSTHTNFVQINPGSGTDTEPALWAIKYVPQSQSNTTDNYLIVENGKFINGMSGYIVARAADNNRNFRTVIVLEDAYMSSTIYGFGKDDPATASSGGWNSDYILLYDYVELYTRNFTAIYDEGPTTTAKYAPTCIRGTYYGSSATSGEAQLYMMGNTYIKGMARKAEYYTGSGYTNNGLGAIDYYANTKNLYIEHIEAYDCENIVVRCKADCDFFRVDGGYLENNAGGCIQASNTSTSVTFYSVRNVKCVGGENPQIVVVGTSTGTRIPKATIENCHCEGGTNVRSSPYGTIGAIYARYVDMLDIKNCYVYDQDEEGICINACTTINVDANEVATVTGGGILLYSADGTANVTNNKITSAGGIGLYVYGGSALANISHNFIDGAVGYGYIATTSGYANFSQNYADNISGSGFYVSVAGTIAGNRLGGTVTAAVYPVAPNNGSVAIYNNSWNAVIVYHSGAPTSGTWARGSVCYNNAPSAGGTLGWVCTTAGTPGTWKTFGAITA